jgi:hypothetical protein|tara:strand:+ start:403 stop:630 length:228 start_codon:yes stop_codon:yes gene_type:complete
MIREKQQHAGPVIIDLTGPNGNAFYLLGTASKLGKQLGFSDTKLGSMLEDMKSGDYDNLIQEFDSYFGDFIILEK